MKNKKFNQNEDEEGEKGDTFEVPSNLIYEKNLQNA